MFWVQTTFFYLESDIYQQEGGVSMGLPLSPVITNIYMGYFEEMGLETAPLKPTVLVRYVDETLILWLPQEVLQILMDHVNPVLFSSQWK